MFGLGGIFAEVLKDRVFRLAPLTEADALAMLEDIRAGKMLGSFRGLPAVERPALAGILKELGNLALLHPEIAEIDLNPIIISEAKPVVVDALVVLKQQGLSGSQDK
jgi:acetyltransferase